jgi:hypothetical protein
LRVAVPVGYGGGVPEPTMRIHVLTLTFLSLAACAGPPEKFNEKISEATCRLQESCQEAQSINGFDYDACVDGLVDATDQCADVCEYNEKAANKCLRAVRSAERKLDCNMNEVKNDDECNFVYTDCNGICAYSF